MHTARPYSRSPCPYSHTRPRLRPPNVHQLTVFARFPALSCTPRTPIYNFCPFSCTFVYAPFRPPRTLRGRCHFRGYTHRNLNCQSSDYQCNTRHDRGRCPPYLDTYRSRVGGRRGKKAAEGEVTREVRSGEIGFFGPVRKNHFTAQQGRRRSAVGEKAAGRWGTKEGRRRKKAKKREEKQRSGTGRKENSQLHSVNTGFWTWSETHVSFSDSSGGSRIRIKSTKPFPLSPTRP